MKDLTEEQLFDIKQKFLREIPHPKLIEKQIAKLDQNWNKKQGSEFSTTNKNSQGIQFIEDYIDALFTIKLNISNSESSEVLLENLLKLKNLQLSLIYFLCELYPQKFNVDDSQIKQSDPFDAYKYLIELKENDIEENQIKDYLCSQFNNSPETFSELAKAVIRARKIMENGR